MSYMEIIYILVRPSAPENIGSATRAIKTMGFNELRLVNTIAHLKDEAKWLAHDSIDILEKAKVYSCLNDALTDIDFTIGTTAKNRSAKYDYYTPEEGRKILLDKADSLTKVAIVFGSEERGLENEELSLCDIAVTIPMETAYPSINLVQSIMIMAYVFSNCELKTPPFDNNMDNYMLLKYKVKTMLNSLGITEGDNLYGRIMERLALIQTPDINLFLSIIGKLNKIIKK